MTLNVLHAFLSNSYSNVIMWVLLLDDETEAHGSEVTYPLTAEPRFQHQCSNSKVDRLSWDTAGLKVCVTKRYNQHT